MNIPENIYDPCPCESGKKYKFCCYLKRREMGVSRDLKACGLCGKTQKLIKTECCGNWICDDEENYQIFSYDRNSCSRNHRRFTLCGSHHTEEHEGSWQECAECHDDVETEMYVWYGTNEYNFEKLTNPPKFDPTYCSDCRKVIRLGDGGYSQKGDEYLCERCTDKMMRGVVTQRKKKSLSSPRNLGK